jgi:hypothetical protein
LGYSIGALLGDVFAINTLPLWILAELFRIRRRAVVVHSCVQASAVDIVGDVRNSSPGPYMDYEDVVTVIVGLLALLGFTLLVVFGITFSEGKTTHPIYKSEKTLRSARQEK